ncbi:hypothetical protein pb186bvf_002134 [Paramecium bursaria]
MNRRDIENQRFQLQQDQAIQLWTRLNHIINNQGQQLMLSITTITKPQMSISNLL